MTNHHEREAQMAVDITTWLTTGEVARELGVSPTRVQQLANCGRLPCLRVGGQRLFDPDAVIDFRRGRER